MLAGFVLGEVWIWQFQRTAALAALVLAVMILIGYTSKKQGSFFYGSYKSLFFLLAFFMLLGGIRSSRWFWEKEGLERVKDQKVHRIEGQIEEITEGENFTRLVLKHLFLIEGESYRKNGQKNSLGGRLLLFAPEGISYGMGHRIVFQGKIEAIVSPTNPGEFDRKIYQENRGVFGCCWNPEILKQSYGSFLIEEGLRKFRKRLSSFYIKYMEQDQSGVALAMVLGEKSKLLPEQKKLYQLGGISHVLAVSGLHMTLVGVGIYKILRKAGCGYGVSAVWSFPCILAYAVLTGSSSSCLRASLMLIVYLLGEWMGLSYDLLSSLCLGGILLLWELPGRLFDSSFLLSFGAMGGIGVVYSFLKDCFCKEKRIKKKLAEGMLGSLSITLATIPLSLYFFHGFSPAGIFLNLLVIPVMSLLLPILILGGILGLLSLTEQIGIGCLFLGGKIIDFYEILCKIAEKIPGGYLTVGYRGVVFAIGYYLVLFFALFLIYKMDSIRKKRMILAVTGCVFCFLITLTGRRDCFLTVLDVGQGDGILFHSKDEVCMIDGGSSSRRKIGTYVLEPALSYYGISYVDNWFVSHGDEDHLSGVTELLESGYRIGRLILPVMTQKTESICKLEVLAKENHTEVIFMKAFDEIKLKEGSFFCLHPSGETAGKDSNENSLVLMLSLPRQNIFLTGDVEKAGEKALNQVLGIAEERNVKRTRKEQVLKVAHHGSSNGTGEEFLELVKPDTALISCGTNNRYGHPGADTLKRLHQRGITVYRTDKQGAIEIRCGQRTEYKTFQKKGRE